MTEVGPVNQPLPGATPERWATETIASLCEFVRDGDWIETKDQGGDAFRLLQISNIGVGRFVETGNFRSISQETFTRLNCTELAVGDVLVARMPEPTGRAWWIDRLPWRAVTAVDVAILRPKANVLDGRYLSYFLNSPACLRFVDGLATGTTRMRVKRRDLETLHVPVPALPVQRRIADMLGALDDRIALNERMAATLETLGRFTYREWREALPQTDFCPIGDVCQVSSGGTPARRTEELWAGPIPWISPKVMTSIHCDEPEEWVSPAAIGRGTRLAPAGSTLVMVRGMGLHERVRVSQAREDVTFNQDVKSLTPVDLEPAMLLFSVLDAQEVLLARVESSGHGTGVLPTSALTGHLVAAPRADVRRSVAGRLELLNDRIAVARSAARTLASLRDALLPRLFGGPEMR